MKAKKYFSLLLAAVLIFSMVACGTETSSAETPASAGAETPSAEAPAAGGAETAAEPETPAAAVDSNTDTPTSIECEPLEISFSTTFNETETGGQIIKHFETYLNELTNGNVTMNIFWGGTLFSDVENLDGVSSGAVNMTSLGHLPHTGTLNYLGFPGFAPGSPQKALDFFNELLFDNAETSELIQGEAADNNIIYLNVIAFGANAFCSTYEFTDLDSLISGSKSFGNMDAAIFEKLGFQVTSVSPGDMYDALQRGLIDSTQMSMAPMVSLGWHDVADYWALDGTYSAGNMWTANLEWWNSLSDAQRQAIQTAADEVEAYSADVYANAIADDCATVEEKTGNQVIEFNQEDRDRIWAASFEAKADAALETAKANGKEEGMTKILEVAADFTGYAWNK